MPILIDAWNSNAAWGQWRSHRPPAGLLSKLEKENSYISKKNVIIWYVNIFCTTRIWKTSGSATAWGHGAMTDQQLA